MPDEPKGTTSSILHQIERYLALRYARSPNTARTYQNGLNRFTQYLVESGIDLDSPAELLTRSLALDFIPWLATQHYKQSKDSEEKPLSMRSRQLYVRAVSGLYRQLALDGTIPLSYGDYVALNAELNKETSFKLPPIEKRLPPDDVLRAILDQVEKTPPALEREDLNPGQRERLNLIWMRDQAIVYCLYSTGMRVGELVHMRRKDLVPEDSGAWVRGKGDRTRFVRFSTRAWAALQAYLSARADSTVPGPPVEKPVFCRHDRAAGNKRRLPLTTVSVERIVTQLAKSSGVLERFNLTPHSFRHYFATRFLGHTGDLALTQDVLGHADPGTTRIYAKTTKAQHIRAHQSLFDRDEKDDLDNDTD